MAAAQIEWTQDRIQCLQGLWAEGHSTAEIGRRIGTSKNAVVGKVHRLNLPARPSPIAPRNPRPPKPPAQRRKPSLPPLTVMAALPAMTAVASASSERAAKPHPVVERVRCGAARHGTCCWPIGEPGRPSFRFCGDPVETLRRPYCDQHCGIAYIPRQPKRHEQEDGDVRT